MRPIAGHAYVRYSCGVTLVEVCLFFGCVKASAFRVGPRDVRAAASDYAGWHETGVCMGNRRRTARTLPDERAQAETVKRAAHDSVYGSWLRERDAAARDAEWEYVAYITFDDVNAEAVITDDGLIARFKSEYKAVQYATWQARTMVPTWRTVYSDSYRIHDEPPNVFVCRVHHDEQTHRHNTVAALREYIHYVRHGNNGNGLTRRQQAQAIQKRRARGTSVTFERRKP